MTDAVDFFQALKSISSHEAMFPAAAEAARVAVGKIVGAQLADDRLDLSALRQIRALLGLEVFAEALDGVPAAKIKMLVTRVDPHAGGLTTAPLRVQRVLALADGTVQPAEPKKAPVRAAKAKPPRDLPADVPAAQPEAATEPAPRKRRMSGRTALAVPQKRSG